MGDVQGPLAAVLEALRAVKDYDTCLNGTQSKKQETNLTLTEKHGYSLHPGIPFNAGLKDLHKLLCANGHDVLQCWQASSAPFKELYALYESPLLVRRYLAELSSPRIRIYCECKISFLNGRFKIMSCYSPVSPQGASETQVRAASLFRRAVCVSSCSSHWLETLIESSI